MGKIALGHLYCGQNHCRPSETVQVSTHSTMAGQRKLGFAENFLLSGVAAGVSKTAAAPIERVKLMVQNQDEMIRQGVLDRPYSGVLDCTKRVLQTEGVYPFWRGNLANVLRYFPTQALNFAFKDTIKATFKTSKDAPEAIKFATNIASGGAAGTMSLLFVYSLDYARTRLANDLKGKDGGDRKYNGLVDVFINRGMYFGLYDTLKPLVLGADAGVGISFLLGWAVTVTAGLMSYPIDTIRRRMMMTSGGAVKYKGSVDCGMQILKNEGFMSMMKGAGANILRGVAGAGVLAGFDKFKELYISFRTAA